MNEPEARSSEPSDALRREAAHWFSHMRGPEAEAARPEFEAWLAQSASHRSAYNHAAEIFAMGKLLAGEVPLPTQRRPHRLTAALALCGLGALVAGSWAMVQMREPAGPPTELAADSEYRSATHATVQGETRSIRLADGSMLTLGSDSAVETRFDPGRRLLRLLRGQGRFDVAHERRAFVVLAGGGSVTARGTVFEVALTPGRQVDVRLLKGAVDVALPGRGPAAPVVRQLRPGEGLSFAVRAPAPVTGGASPSPAAAAIAMRDYQGVTVAALVDEANRTAARPIRLADPGLGAKRVSGRFRIDDTAQLAERLAALFDGKVDRDDGREIVLSR